MAGEIVSYPKGVLDATAEGFRWAAVMAARVPGSPDATRAQWITFINGLLTGISGQTTQVQLNRLTAIVLTWIQLDCGSRRFLGEENLTALEVSQQPIPNPVT